jgi:hypothetical protein
MSAASNWLLSGPAWVRYRTYRDMLGQPEAAAPVQAARAEMLADPQIQALVAELQGWPGPALKRHNDAGHLLHKATFLADLGLRANDPGMDVVVERMLAHPSSQGPLRVIVNISPSFGGTGQDQWAWSLCDAPLVLYALAEFGLGQDERVLGGVQSLVKLLLPNGWPCASSPEIAFRGPGKRADPCPFATLAMCKLLAVLPAWRDTETARVGTETLLSLWEQRRERRPYLFGMGTDFGKLKAPLVWYDILHVADVLSRFPHVRSDERLRDMLGVIAGKVDVQGRYTPESIWMAWKSWEFGQKKAPSSWVTFLAARALRRMEGSEG